MLITAKDSSNLSILLNLGRDRFLHEKIVMPSTDLVPGFHLWLMLFGYVNHESYIFNFKKKKQFVSLFIGEANSICSSK